MQKKSPLNSAPVSPRTLVILFVCAAACLTYFASALDARADSNIATPQRVAAAHSAASHNTCAAVLAASYALNSHLSNANQ